MCTLAFSILGTRQICERYAVILSRTYELTHKIAFCYYNLLWQFSIAGCNIAVPKLPNTIWHCNKQPSTL